jgi:hypothetical protein
MAKDDKYIPDEGTLEAMERVGVRDPRTRPSKIDRMPSTGAGLPSLRVRDLPYLEDTNTRGFVVASNRLKDKDSNRRRDQTVFKAPSAGADTTAHEIEHLLARQNLGFAQSTRDKFEELLGEGSNKPTTQVVRKRGDFLDGLIESAPYLKEKYGIDNAYMDPEFIREQGRVGLYEILATLAGTEAAQNVDLTKDPVLRKTLFKDKDVRETYNAVTGLRQTRLDPRDLPPYTRQPEKDAGMVDRVKQMMKFAEGGYVPNAGRTKII